MPSFSTRSKRQLQTCREPLRLTALRAIRIIDFTVLEGYRHKERQNKLHRDGKSKLRWPQSKHNQQPSAAFDFAPWPIDWQDARRFAITWGVLRASFADLQALGIIPASLRLRWGGDWDMDEHTDDNRFDDLGHVELIQE